MAKLYPPMELIQKSLSKPTEGELLLLNSLINNLDDSYEVYFQPLLNGDNPDIVVLRSGFGVLIIEVKDWRLENYYLKAGKKWVLVKNDAPIKSPLSQVHNYKQNLYDLHIETLLERKISDINLLNIVNCVVFFAMESTAAICDFIDPKKNWTIISTLILEGYK